MGVIQDHGKVVKTGKRLVGLNLGHSSYQHGLTFVARALERTLYWRQENTLLPLLPSDLLQSHFLMSPTQMLRMLSIPVNI